MFSSTIRPFSKFSYSSIPDNADENDSLISGKSRNVPGQFEVHTKKTSYSKYVVSTFIFVAALCVVLFWPKGLPMSVELDATTIVQDSSPKVLPYFDPLGRFIMRNFHARKSMSNFLPGIAGVWGKPLWGMIFLLCGILVNSF